MNNLRSTYTLRLVVLAAALALGSQWLVEVMRHQTYNILPETPRTDPDFYVEKFNFVRMGKNGEAHYSLRGSQMLHYPADDSYLVLNPIMHSYGGTDRLSMVSQSKLSTVHNNTIEVHMYDDVHLDPATVANFPEFPVEDVLSLLPD